jgi:glutathione transport system permease protein
MLGYLVRRTALAVVPGIRGLTLVFCIVRVLPGEVPSHVILGDFASQAALEALRTALGLDLPLWALYASSCAMALSGRLGHVHGHRAPVVDEILRVLPWTLS